MTSTYANQLMHIVFSTKNREALISTELADRLYSFMGGIARNRRCILLAAGGMPDHVHLLVSLHPTMASAALIRDVKANSSRWLRQEIGVRTFRWQDGYGIFSVSQSNIDSVRAYIASQASHHNRKSYMDEFIRLLDRNDIKYDPKYVFD